MMKTCLILLAVALILFAVVAMLASIVIFVIARKKKAAVQNAAGPGPTSRIDQPSMREPSGSAATVVASLPGQGTIVFVTGPFEGRSYEVTTAGTWIGRDETANLILGAASVSKKHTWIGVKSGRAVVIDEGSTNGTFLGSPHGERITNHMLEDGDTIVIADDVARFRYER